MIGTTVSWGIIRLAEDRNWVDEGVMSDAMNAMWVGVIRLQGSTDPAYLADGGLQYAVPIRLLLSNGWPLCVYGEL